MIAIHVPSFFRIHLFNYIIRVFEHFARVFLIFYLVEFAGVTDAAKSVSQKSVRVVSRALCMTVSAVLAGTGPAGGRYGYLPVVKNQR